MKNLIWSYWRGPIRPQVRASIEAMMVYAERIGASYRFDDDRTLRPLPAAVRSHVNPTCFTKLAIVFDPWFDQFDKVLFCDCDVFPVRGLTVSIFEQPFSGWAMAEEPHQPEYRQHRRSNINGAQDEVWAGAIGRHWGLQAPRDRQGRVRTFNSGVILWTPQSRASARERFLAPVRYYQAMKPLKLPGFYWNNDQQYLNAMACLPDVTFDALSPEWNRTIHFRDDGTIYDGRTPATKFVHVQLRGSDDRDATWHRQYTKSL